MRIARALAAIGMVALALAGGCGRKETYTTPEGAVTVERRGGETEVTVEGEEGTVEFRGDESRMMMSTEEGMAVVETRPDVTEEEIGMPVYLGATVERSVKQTDEEGEESFTQVHLSTSDAFAKVKAFYQEKVPKAAVGADVETPDLKMLQMTWAEEGEEKMVMVSRDRSDTVTRIVLHRAREGE